MDIGPRVDCELMGTFYSFVRFNSRADNVSQPTGCHGYARNCVVLSFTRRLCDVSHFERSVDFASRFVFEGASRLSEVVVFPTM